MWTLWSYKRSEMFFYGDVDSEFENKISSGNINDSVVFLHG